MSDKDLFQEIKKYATEISKEEDITKSFPYLCLKIYFPKLTDEDIEKSIEGLGSNDDSIDAFWIDDEDEVVNIVQFKSSTSAKRAKDNWAEKAWFSFLADTDRKLLDDVFATNCKNNRIKTEICSEYRQAKHDGYTIKFHLFHLGHCSEDIIKSYPNVEYYSFNDICEKYKEFQSMTSYENPKECEIKLSFPNNSEQKYLEYQAKYNNGLKGTYVVILTGRDLIDLRKKHRYQLFDRNVRYFLGETNSVNKEIIRTAKETPEIFYCYNNGITITCSECQLKGHGKDRFKLIYPQIINGAQTVNSLYSAFESIVKENQKGRSPQDKEQAEWIALSHFDKIKILCRIVTSTKTDNSNFANNLTKYTNSQNDVKVFDFCANRPEQIELQKKFSKYGYFYERKRGERDYLKKSKLPHENLNKKLSDFEYQDVKIDIKTIAGIYQAYLGKPSYTEVNYKTILSNFNRDDYKEIFGTNSTDITDEKVKNMILAVNIYNVIDEQIRLFEKANKSWGELTRNPNDENKIHDFKNRVNQISFISSGCKEDIATITKFDEKNISDINRIFIKKYELISRSRYMFTGLIKHILDKNNYTSQILDNNLFNNAAVLKSNLCTWMSLIMTNIIKFVYSDIERMEGTISIENFYKRIGIFEKLIERITDLRHDEDWNLKEKFKFDIMASKV